MEMKINEVLQAILPCDMNLPYVFISYSSDNKEIVWRDVLEYQRRGYNIWLDEKNLDKTKDSWEKDAIRAVQDICCELVVFYVSRDSLCSVPCYNEMCATRSPEARESHNADVKFIAVDVAPIDDIVTFSDKIHAELRKAPKLSKDEKKKRAAAVFHFKEEIFSGNNKRVRVHAKNAPDRMLDYFDEITEYFPQEAKIRPEEPLPVPLEIAEQEDPGNDDAKKPSAAAAGQDQPDVKVPETGPVAAPYGQTDGDGDAGERPAPTEKALSEPDTQIDEDQPVVDKRRKTHQAKNSPEEPMPVPPEIAEQEDPGNDDAKKPSAAAAGQDQPDVKVPETGPVAAPYGQTDGDGDAGERPVPTEEALSEPDIQIDEGKPDADAEIESILSLLNRYDTDPVVMVKPSAAAEDATGDAENKNGDPSNSTVDCNEEVASILQYHSADAEKNDTAHQSSYVPFDPSDPKYGDAEESIRIGLDFFKDGDYKLAYIAFQTASYKEYPLAEYYLAICYDNGYGVKKDRKKATELFDKAAMHGLVDALSRTAIRYLKGEGVKQNHRKALYLLWIGDSQNDPESIYWLGKCYEYGWITERKNSNIKMDHSFAMNMYKKAADMGHVGAQYSLGRCYETGACGIKDVEKAIQYYSLAANQGNADAKKKVKRLKRNI